MSPAERVRIEELLQDETLSFRAIGRETGYSDFTIRKISRELTGDARPMKTRRSRRDTYESADDAPLAWWITPLLILGGIGLAIFLGVRGSEQ